MSHKAPISTHRTLKLSAISRDNKSSSKGIRSMLYSVCPRNHVRNETHNGAGVHVSCKWCRECSPPMVQWSYTRLRLPIISSCKIFSHFTVLRGTK